MVPSSDCGLENIRKNAISICFILIKFIFKIAFNELCFFGKFSSDQVLAYIRGTSRLGC